MTIFLSLINSSSSLSSYGMCERSLFAELPVVCKIVIGCVWSPVVVLFFQNILTDRAAESIGFSLESIPTPESVFYCRLRLLL